MKELCVIGAGKIFQLYHLKSINLIDSIKIKHIVDKNFELANSAAAAALDAELYATVNRAFAIDYVSNTTTTGTLSLTSPRYKDGYIFLDEGEGNSGELIRLKHNGAATDWPIDAEATSSEYEGIVEEVIYPVVKKGSGDILYIENRFPVIRDSDQIEDLKMIITY